MEPTNIEQYIRDIQDNIAGFHVESIVFEGEGDFCRAFTINDQWIFRFAHNSEGSQTLEREAVLLPKLAPTIKLDIPNIAYFGRQREGNLAFVGYPKVQGVELTRELLLTLKPHELEQCAHDLADFLNELHSFDTTTAQHVGVLGCDYPFARTEDGIMQGSASDLYHAELERLLGYPILDEDTRRCCKQLVAELLYASQQKNLPASLIHGDLSPDHVLFDLDTKRISGVIDFSDAILCSPMLDYMYLYHSYGSDFLALLLNHHHKEDSREIIEDVRLLHHWYIVLRLLWALDHDYPPGIEANLRVLHSLCNASIKNRETA